MSQKILFVIDSLGAGGAQRQMVALANSLVRDRYTVEFFNYYPDSDFFRSSIDSSIKTWDYRKRETGFSLHLVIYLRRLIQARSFDIVLAYLEGPSLYAMLSALWTKTRVIVSDRNSYLKYNPVLLAVKRQAYRLADHIVANSFAQTKWLTDTALLSRRNLTTIPNGYEPDSILFSPSEIEEHRNSRLLSIGRINPQKNIETLIRALAFFYSRHLWVPSMTWVGVGDHPAYERKIRELLNQYPEVASRWTWIPESRSINELFSTHDVFVLPSRFEGLPNVVCEALFAGKPIIVSNVCDHSWLVKEGERGFLFNPESPRSLVNAIEKMLSIENDQWDTFARNARQFAEEHLSLQRMTAQYRTVFRKVLDR